MDTILLAFLKKESNNIISRSLVRNFVGHLTSLHEAGVIKLETVLQSLVILQLGSDTSESLTGSQFSVSWSQPSSDASCDSASLPSMSPSTTVEAEPSPSVAASPGGDHTP